MKINELAPGYRARLFEALIDQHRQQGGWDQVFQLLSQGRQAARAASMPQIEHQLEEGQNIVLQGLKDSGRFLPAELPVMALGLATGDIGQSYRRLRDQYLLQQRFAAELRRQFNMPLAVVLVVLTLMDGWLVAEQQLSAGLGCALWLLSVLVVTAVALGLSRIIGAVVFGTGFLKLRRLLRPLPLFKDVFWGGQLLHFFHNLRQSMTANLALAQALKTAARKIPDPFYQRRLLAVYEAVQRGDKLSAALAHSGILKGVAMKPMRRGDASAEAAMLHIAEAVQDHFIQQLQLLVHWLPQILFIVLPLIAFAQALMIP